MKLEYLGNILAVARCGSISAAAKELWINQSTLSMSIRAVEEELGITLFTRSFKGVVLTSEGKRAIGEIRKIFDAYDTLKCMSESNVYKNQLCECCCYPGQCPGLGSWLSIKLSAEPYNVILKMKSILSRKITSAVFNGTANLGVGSVTRVELESEKKFAQVHDLNFEELYVDNFVLCVGGKSRFFERDSVDISELTDAKISSVSFAPQFTGYYPSLDFRQFKQQSVFDLEECVKRTIMNCDAVTFIPGLCLKSDFYVKNGAIRPIKLTGFDTNIINFIVYPDLKKLTPAERLALDFIKEYFSNISGEGHQVN